jgi:hypothetical protein
MPFLPIVLSLLKKHWLPIVGILSILGAVGYIYHKGKQECQNEVIIKELTHVVEVTKKQNAAAANRPASRTAVIERLLANTY